MDPTIRYAVVAQSRSGSTYLCDLLTSTNRLGSPKEYFNPELVCSYMKEFNVIQHDDYVNKLYWATKKDNDTIGVKIISDYQSHLCLAKGYDYLSQVTHWIWLKRENTVAQAISRYKAWKTGVYTYDKHSVQPQYCFSDIKFMYDEINNQNQRDTKFFEDKDVLEISYEQDLLVSPEQVVLVVLNYLGLPVEDLPQIKSCSTKNEENKEWEEAFRLML